MQFQIKGQDYFLHFDRDEGRWYLLWSAPSGIQRVPVVHDAPEYGPVRYVLDQNEEEQKVVN